jgi:lipopolysaccharide transport system ATP-binding protein
VPRFRRLLGQRAPNYFREFWAVREVSFEVRKGETVGIIGRNGSGKSTVLQLICGTLTPTTGAIDVNGRVAALLELGSGFNPEFTGRENVYLNGSVLGLTHREIDSRMAAIATFADIGDFLEQPVKMYSSGMSVRLAFAVIAHVDADILVIDEALSVGDAYFTQKCMRFLRDFMTRGTVLFVSHDTAAVNNLCQRAIWMQEGQVKFDGPAKDAAGRYLEALTESLQGPTQVTIGPEPTSSGVAVDTTLKDMRLQFLNASQYRNDIEIFRFESGTHGFGRGDAEIVSVRLTDLAGAPLSWVVGGEDVILDVGCAAKRPLNGPIIGFFVKDRLGQYLFGDNTFLTYRSTPVLVEAGQRLSAQFQFRMPLLPRGDFSLDVALAEGTQEDHIQHHWIIDALVFTSVSTSVCTGLIGIPMIGITLAAGSEIDETKLGDG